MDAEKRHHLKQNDLAEALAKLRELGSRKELLYWVAGIVVVIAAVFVYRSWGTWQANRAARSWLEYSEVNRKVESNTPGALDELRGIISSSSNPTLTAAARIQLAAALRAKAGETATVDTSALQEAIEVLKPLLNEPGSPPPVVGAAALSLASCYETLGQFDDAEQIYKILSDEQRFAGTGYAKAAAERLKTLPDLRKPVEFVAGLPPQPAAPAAAGAQPSIQVISPDGLAGPPLPPPEPAEHAQPADNGSSAATGSPAAAGESGETAPGGAATPEQPAGQTPETGSEAPAPATQPSGSQGP
jgi:predicted negative regulator of RcsB-dependent stress response